MLCVVIATTRSVVQLIKATGVHPGDSSSLKNLSWQTLLHDALRRDCYDAERRATKGVPKN